MRRRMRISKAWHDRSQVSGAGDVVTVMLNLHIWHGSAKAGRNVVIRLIFIEYQSHVMHVIVYSIFNL